MKRKLPSMLEKLTEIATDVRWIWSHAGDALWRAMDPETWLQTRNPYVVLQNLSQQRLEELAKDKGFIERLQKVVSAREAYCAESGWYGETYPDAGLKGVAYFSMEFGLGEALPLYAGGLGILAGDYLKAVSDLGVPVVGIGLLYQEGYFRQTLDDAGWQQDVYPYNDPTSLPVTPVDSDSGAWLTLNAALPGRTVRFRVWQAKVGRVSLYLLDSNDPLNSPADRGITTKLYGGGKEMRLVQEIALGVCGWRLIEALGLEVDVCHLNEGHAAFVTLERAHAFMRKHQVDFWQALWATRAGNVFTTHTPVPAGFDTFERDLLLKYGQVFADQVGVDAQAIGALGRINSSDHGLPFNMAYLAMRSCARTNGVSELHGKVSREIFQSLFPRWPEHEVPVTHVTNGVHVPSWDSAWADEIWTRAGGKKRWLGSHENLTAAIDELTDETLWNFRGQERADLVSYARRRLARQLSQRGESQIQIAQCQDVLDPNVLTLGFARRFAEYKRPNLLLHDQERLVRLLTDSQRPVQVIVAGKAHPQDKTGKEIVQQWARFVQRPEVRAHAVFLEDYDISLAQELVQGVDVWINTPRRPWEACGTSGMKVLVNGGLNLSELDGWWAEAYSPEVGWALGNSEPGHDASWDAHEAEQLYHLLEEQVVPEFYNRDEHGIPSQWVQRMRASMSRLTPQFSTNRMVQEYVEQLYLPAARDYSQRSEQDGSLAQSLMQWQQSLQHHWYELRWGNLNVQPAEQGWHFSVQVYLGEIAPDSVQVQLYTDGENAQLEVMKPMEVIPGSLNGYCYQAEVKTDRPHAEFTPRIVPFHSSAKVPTEANMILWWSA